MSLPVVRAVILAALMFARPAITAAQVAPAALPAADRPFAGLREQAAMQQAWLKKRLLEAPPLDIDPPRKHEDTK